MGGVLSGPVMVSEDVKFFVDNLIASKPVVVFSKTYCKYSLVFFQDVHLQYSLLIRLPVFS